jgi:hypothetical protein
MRAHADQDLLLVEAMLAPPALEDARSSLEYWEERQRALPLYKRGARREAREMAARWQERVRAAERIRFEATVAGRILAAVGLSRFFVRPAWSTKGGLIVFAWTFLPRRLKLVAAGVVAAWLLAAAVTITVLAVAFSQLM